MSDLTYEMAKRAEGDRFRLASRGDIPVELTLTEVKALRRPGDTRSGMRDPFSLLFEADAVLAQGCYRLASENMQKRLIFLVPLGPAPGGKTYLYQAVHN